MRHQNETINSDQLNLKDNHPNQSCSIYPKDAKKPPGPGRIALFDAHQPRARVPPGCQESAAKSVLWGLTSSSSEPTAASPSAARLPVTAGASAKALAGLPADVFETSALLDASLSMRGHNPEDGEERNEVY